MKRNNKHLFNKNRDTKMKKIFLIISLCLATTGLFAQNTEETHKCNHNNGTCCQAYKASRHHFTMTLGYGYLFGDTENTDLFINYANESHQRRMHNGINFELDYDYNFHKNFAAGVVFSMYNSFDSYYPSSTATETYSDDKYLFYVGPSFLAHTDLMKDKWTVYGRATVGFMNFRNAIRNVGAITYKRGTFGYGIEAGCDYLVNKYFSVIGQVSYMGGSISKVKNGADQEFELNETEDLSRLNVSVGVKIKL